MNAGEHRASLRTFGGVPPVDVPNFGNGGERTFVSRREVTSIARCLHGLRNVEDLAARYHARTAKPLLGLTMAEIQRRTPCPRCGARMPQMLVAGVVDPGPLGEQLRYELFSTLIEAGLKPTDYGIDWRTPTVRR